MWTAQFRLYRVGPALSWRQITRVRFGGCGDRQDQTGSGLWCRYRRRAKWLIWSWFPAAG